MVANQKPDGMEDEEVMPRVKTKTPATLPSMVDGQFEGKRNKGSVSSYKIYEQPWHRTAAILRASGWSIKQIADHMGHCHESMRGLDRTPWFQSHVNKLIEERVGATDVLALAKARAIDAHNVIIRLMNDATIPAAVQLQAAKTIHEQVYGKPVQKIESDSTIRSGDPCAEVERLQKEAADLRMRLGDQAG